MTTEQMDAVGAPTKPSRLQKAIAQSERAEGTERTTNLDEYETVAERVTKFWRKYKNGRIATEIVEKRNVGAPPGAYGSTQWIVKASVWRDVDEEDEPAANGFATETDGLGDEITANSALETAETSAIGRALANLGLNGKKPRASREGVARTAAKIEAAKAVPAP